MNRRIRNVIGAGVTGVVAVALVAGYWPSSAVEDHATVRGSPGSPSTGSSQTRRTAPPTISSQRSGANSDAAQSARSLADVLDQGSLRGTVADGRVRLGPDGRVVADVELRRMLDYYLTTIGELDVGQIRSLLLQQLRGRHADAVVQQVLDVFDRYVAYQRAVAAIDPGSIADPRERLAQVQRLRREHLGEALAEAFFGEEERYARIAAERLSIVGDTALSTSERERKILDLDAQLPPDLRAERDDASSAQLADRQAQRFEAAGTAPQDRYAERAALWGTDAARRLAALDAERAQWDARVAAYERARGALLANARASVREREAEVQALLERSFSANEQRRVLALEQTPP